MTYKTITIGLLIALAFIAIMALVDKRDEAVMVSAERYEKCVLEEYRTTPSAWYQQHGEYPTCDAK